MAEANSDGKESLFTARLDYLFQTIRRGDGRQYAPADVAEAINEAAGHDVISGTYVWQLRTGRRSNPTYKHMVALSRFFKVSPAYFFDDADLERGALPAEVSAAVQNDKVRDIALRTVGLSDRSMKVIADMIDNVRALDPAPSAIRKPRRARDSRHNDLADG